MLLTDLINKIEIGGTVVSDEDISSLNNIKDELLNKFNNELDNIALSGTTTNSQITNQQQNHDGQITRIPETQLAQQLQASLASALLGQTPVLQHQHSQDNINISLKDLESLILKAVKEANNSDLSVIQNSTSISTKKLSRNALTDIRQSIFIRYKKLLKIENTIAIFQSHKDNKTVPNALSFLKFPKPLWAVDSIFVDEHNDIIRNNQMQMIDSIINRGRILVDCLNVELAEIRSKLEVTYDGNKDRFFDNIKASVTNNLKPFFEASNSKLLRLQNNYFEDRIDTEYEIQELVSDEYINSYLQINYSNVSNKTTNDTKDYTTKKNLNSVNTNPVTANQITPSFVSNKYNNNNKRKFFKHKNQENGSLNSNWRNNMQQHTKQQRYHLNNQQAYQQHNNNQTVNKNHLNNNLNTSKQANFQHATNLKYPP